MPTVDNSPRLQVHVSSYPALLLNECMSSLSRLRQSYQSQPEGTGYPGGRRLCPVNRRNVERTRHRRTGKLCVGTGLMDVGGGGGVSDFVTLDPSHRLPATTCVTCGTRTLSLSKRACFVVRTGSDTPENHFCTRPGYRLRIHRYRCLLPHIFLKYGLRRKGLPGGDWE